MIMLHKGFGSEYYHCARCKYDLFSVGFDDRGQIFIICPSCYDELKIGITTGTHELLMKEAKE